MPHRPTTIALAALSAAVVAAFAVPAASAAPAALQRATNKCWLDVINDWLDNNHVDKIYAPPCYTQAIQHLSALPDVSGYSSAIDDIHRAQLAAIHQQQNGGGGGPSSGGGAGPTSGGNSGPGSGNGGAGAGTGGGDTGTSTPGGGGVGGIGGPTDATSVPLPLIILGALAVLLALAGLATWGARRFQTRRPAPAPAVPRRR